MHRAVIDSTRFRFHMMICLGLFVSFDALNAYRAPSKV